MSQFLKDLHAQVLEQMLQGELDAHWGYEKHSPEGYRSGNSRNGTFPKKIQTEYGAKTIEIPRDRNGDFTQTRKPWPFHRASGHLALCQRSERVGHRR